MSPKQLGPCPNNTGGKVTQRGGVITCSRCGTACAQAVRQALQWYLQPTPSNTQQSNGRSQRFATYKEQKKKNAKKRKKQ